MIVIDREHHVSAKSARAFTRLFAGLHFLFELNQDLLEGTLGPCHTHDVRQPCQGVKWISLTSLWTKENGTQAKMAARGPKGEGDCGQGGRLSTLRGVQDHEVRAYSSQIEFDRGQIEVVQTYPGRQPLSRRRLGKKRGWQNLAEGNL